MLLALVSFPSRLSLSQQQPCRSNYLPRCIIAFKDVRKPLNRITRPQILPSTFGDAFGFRVFVLSDLHTDYPENLKWDRFQHVFYVPGNHDLWCRWEQDHCLDSLEKLNKLLDACRGLGVETKPMAIEGLGIIPLFSWYHESFDREQDITGIRIPSLEMACKDFRACKWPQELSSRDTSLALYFDAMNEENEDKIKARALSREEDAILSKPPKIIGSDCLEVRIRSIHGTKGNASACHVFGHTHFCWDAMLDGIRYVQAPLAYPRERKRRMNGGETWLPFCIYSDGNFADRLSPCYWSDYYAANPRAPHNTELAPWVARFYNRL
ncbi:hypothetical protein GH714_035034 [Hevea brasiliensis]|uniref:Calcineurin-like phosphoesterase domain-containing protein n=1 Tax=Hevea brasiliensis TaxID=3981 RepID=A0A6A6MJK9_HEVBR|nr:hypothetical protein GH714_035034 [Hevea brasiliensis]